MGDSESKQFGDKFLGKLEGQLDQKAPVFGKSLFVGAGDATRNAWDQGTDFANGLNASGGLTDPMRNAMASFGSIGAGYGSVGANGGLTSGQSNAMAGLNGLGSQFAGLGGLNATQQGASAGTRALGSAYSDLSGAYDQEAPGYARMRQSMLDDAVTNVGSGFTQSGRFGGGSYINDATEASLNAIAPLDYQNYQNNVNNQYRSLDSQKGIYDTLFGQGQQGRDNSMGALNAQQGVFGDVFGMGQTGQGNRLAALSGQQGAATSQFNAGQQGITNQQGAIDALGQIGAGQDANAQGKRLGAADLFDRTHNAELDRLLKLGAAFGDPVGAANEPPWWQQALGYFAGNAGQAMRTGS